MVVGIESFFEDGVICCRDLEDVLVEVISILIEPFISVVNNEFYLLYFIGLRMGEIFIEF